MGDWNNKALEIVEEMGDLLAIKLMREFEGSLSSTRRKNPRAQCIK